MPKNTPGKNKAAPRMLPVIAALDRTKSGGKAHDVVLAHAKCTHCDYTGLLPSLASVPGACPSCGSETKAVRQDQATVTVPAAVVASEMTHIGTCPSCGTEHRASHADALMASTSLHCVVCNTEYDVDLEVDPEDDVEDGAYDDGAEDDEGYEDDGQAEDAGAADAEGMAEDEAAAMSQDDTTANGFGDDDATYMGAPEDEGADEEDMLLADEEATPEVFARLKELRLAKVDADFARASQAIAIASEGLMTAQPEAADAIEDMTQTTLDALQTATDARRSTINAAFRKISRGIAKGDSSVLAAVAALYASPDALPAAPGTATTDQTQQGASEEEVDGMPNPNPTPEEEAAAKAKAEAEAKAKADAEAAAQAGASGGTALVDDAPGVAVASIKVNLLKQAVAANKGKPLSTYAHIMTASPLPGMSPMALLMVGNSVVATLRKEKASPVVQARFGVAESLSKAFFNAASDGAALDDKGFADTFGLEPVTVEVPLDQAVQVKVQEAVTAAQADQQRALQELPGQFMNAVDIALNGINKGMFALPPEADLVQALAARLESAGFRGAHALVANVFADKGAAFFDEVLNQTEALLDKPEPVRAEIAKVVQASATTLAQTPAASIPARAAQAGVVTASFSPAANYQGARPKGAALPGLITLGR